MARPSCFDRTSIVEHDGSPCRDSICSLEPTTDLIPNNLYEDGAALVALGDDLEQQVGAEFVDWEVPELIDDE